MNSVPVVVDCPIALDEPEEVAPVHLLTITWHCPACGCDSYEEVKRTGEQAAMLPKTAAYTVTCDDCEEKRMARLRACVYRPLYPDDYENAPTLVKGRNNKHIFQNRLAGKFEAPPERDVKNRL